MFQLLTLKVNQGLLPICALQLRYLLRQTQVNSDFTQNIRVKILWVGALTAYLRHSSIVDRAAHYHDGRMIKTLPKAKRTRELSSSCQSNFLKSYPKFRQRQRNYFNFKFQNWRQLVTAVKAGNSL